MNTTQQNKEEEQKKLLQNNHICRAQIITTAPTEEYDFEAVAVPYENGQIKYNWREEKYFLEVLRTGAENIDTSRLESGLPIFDNHPWDTSTKNLLGITTGYTFEERGIVVRVKWGARADEALRADVRNGVLKTVSIEGSIQRYIMEEKQGEIPHYYADLWTPYSLSLAPVPQDIGAQIEVKRSIEQQIERQKIEFKKDTEVKNCFKTISNKF